MRNLAKVYNDEIGEEVKYQAVVDLEGNHFQLLKLGWYKRQFFYAVLLHLDINAETGNIWVQQNNTEILLDEELKKFAGIPKKHFVLGFRPEFAWKHSEFAVA